MASDKDSARRSSADSGETRGRHATDPITSRGRHAAPSRGSHAASAEATARPASAPAPASTARARRRRKGGAWAVVFWVSLAVFIGAVGVLAYLGFGYYSGQQTYDDLADEVFDAAAFEQVDDAEGVTLADLSVDWEALQAINPDVVGWIYIPGTVVNYPITQGDDDEYYLTHDIYGNGGSVRFGTIFLSAGNSADFSDDNNLLYGHHMANGSMFAFIGDITSQDDFDSCRTIYILTPNGNYMLRTFALVDVDASDASVIVQNFDSDEERIAYLEDIISRSLVTATDIADLEDMTQIYMFCTCDELITDGRYLLYAYVVESTVDGDDSSSVTVIDPDDVTAVTDASGETTGTSDEDETTEDETTEE